MSAVSFESVKGLDYADKSVWDRVVYKYGGKGASLMRMTAMGLPVPPGFTIPARTDSLHDWSQIVDFVKDMFPSYGSGTNPQLLSCRSGAAVSMPGMMDTVLCLGINDANYPSLVRQMSPPVAANTYCRLLKGFGTVVLGIDESDFPRDYGDVDAFKVVVGDRFPQDVFEQLRVAVDAVFSSWKNERAVEYRKNFGISHELGTACTVQAMVFGNQNENSGTGVCFTRNPNTGVKELYGEYLCCAQGEDVVSGDRQGVPVSNMPEHLFKQLQDMCTVLECEKRDAQDIEFTVENGKLYLLQTRDAKRTAAAAVRIAADMYAENIIDRATAVCRVTPDQISSLLRAQFATSERREVVCMGTPASPGAAVGRLAFTTSRAKEMTKVYDDVILFRPFTKPDDVPAFFVVRGVITASGGPTSHAAVVARQIGVPCVVGTGSEMIDSTSVSFGGHIFHEGDVVSMDGATGEVMVGALDLVCPDSDSLDTFAETILSLADEICVEADGLRVWANADCSEDAERALKYGAKGIGLCRTEHQFFKPERLKVVRRVLEGTGGPDDLDAVEKFQRGDFYDLLKTASGCPVIIRLLDPPLHEFLPDCEELSEENPMLGLRGVRLGLLRPEITSMQCRAIRDAYVRLRDEGMDPKPYIMVPFISFPREMKVMRERIETVVGSLPIPVGCMIETPSAAMQSDDLSMYADFFSVGSNDLTQMALGISRDDCHTFVGEYVEEGLIEDDPFVTMHPVVARLIHAAAIKSDVQSFGLCGEHGGDTKTIERMARTLNYVSCSPFRVPGARLAAARSYV